MGERTIENPVTKERITIRPADPGLLRVEVSVPPDMIRPPLHVHPHQDEAFLVLQGQVTVQAGRDQHFAALRPLAHLRGYRTSYERFSVR
jgi:quercetin dioxygenase-like cupin family protein